MFVDFFLGSVGEGIALGGAFVMMLWMLFCVVYAIIFFCIPFILYGIMRNTKRSADLLAEIRTFQENRIDRSLTNTLPPALPTSISPILKVGHSSVNIPLKNPI
jgi:hypothetical protein